MYVGVLGLSCCTGLLAKYKWLNYLLIGLYLAAQYLTALRRGRIGHPAMHQFITVSIGGGLLCLYYATGIPNKVNGYINQLFMLGIMMATVYIYLLTIAKAPKPDTEYLLSRYKKCSLAIEKPEDCVVCLDLVSFSQVAMRCKYCKHVFHKTCLRKWCDESAACPHCRHEYH